MWIVHGLPACFSDFLNDVWIGAPYSPLLTCLTIQQVAALEARLAAVWQDVDERIALLRTPLLTELSSHEGAEALGGAEGMPGPPTFPFRARAHVGFLGP